MPTQALRLRIKSILSNGKIYPITPEFHLRDANSAAPGVAGKFLFVAPRPCKLVRIDYVADTAGAGASVIALRKHVAGQTAAANAATSGTNIVQLVTGDIPADATVRVPVTWPSTGKTFVTANQLFATGDKMAMVTPATWIGTLTIWLAWV
jgi:hypothetical protein